MDQDFIKKVFKALPHVDNIWIVNDTFYLDGTRGGDKINRSDVEQSKGDKKKKPSDEGFVGPAPPPPNHNK